jgi:iron complex outermembrane receptor protein
MNLSIPCHRWCGIIGYRFQIGAIYGLFGFSFIANAQERPDSIPQIGLPEVTISALRVPFKASISPYSISVMNARTNTMGLSLAESFSGLPGLQINTRYNFAVGDRITNRGFGARTQFGVRGIRIVSDDMPVTFADGQSNLEMIDLNKISHVEFLRGPGSSLYGNAAGGVLVLHNRDISDNLYLGSITSTIGSNGLFRLTGSLEGTIGKSKISADYSEFSYDGFREHANAEYKRGSLKLVIPLSAKDILQFSAGAVKFNSMNPGSLTKQESGEEPNIANPSSVSNAAGQNGNQVQLAVTLKHRNDSASMLKATVYGIRRSVVNPIIGKIIVLPQFSGGYVISYDSKLMLWNRKASWSAGSELAFRFNDRKNYINNGGERGDLTINQKEQILGSGWFAQLLYPATDRLYIDGCLRYDLTYFNVDNKLTSTGDINSTNERIMHSLNPSFGISYSISPKLRLFANISTSFETPTSTELVNRPDGTGGFNPDLNPSKAIQYETGFRGAVGNLITYDFAMYIIHTRNELIPFEVTDNPGQVYYRNAGSTIHRGGELTFRFSPLPFLDLNSSFTYTNAFYKNFVAGGIDNSGNKIPGVNRIHISEELKLHSSKGIYLSFLMHDFGRMYVDDANTASTPNYALFDIGLGHEGVAFGKEKYLKLIISGGISNIFDIRYITSVTVNAAASRFYEPGPGRTFFVNIRFEAGK